MTDVMTPAPSDTGEIRLRAALDDPTRRLHPNLLRSSDATVVLNLKEAPLFAPTGAELAVGARAFVETPPPPPVPLPPTPGKVLVPLRRPVPPVAETEPVGYIGRHRASDDAPPVINGAPSREWPRLVAKLWKRGGKR